MFALLAKIVVVIAVGLSAAGGTVAAAAGSLPDSALYPVKIGVEDIRLSLAEEPAEQAKLAMEFAGERLQELQQMALQGVAPTDEVMNRLHVQLQTALQKTAQIEDDEELLGLLQQLRQQIRLQEEELAEMPVPVQARVRAQIQKAQEELSVALAAVEDGLQDVGQYRWRHAENRPDDAPPQPEMLPQPETPAVNQFRHGAPAEEVEETEVDEPEEETSPEPKGAQKGDLERDRIQDQTNRPEDAPGGPAGPVQDGPGEPVQEPGQPGEPVQNKNQQQGPSSELPVPAQTTVRTQEQTGPLADPPTDNGEQTLTQEQDGPPEEYPEPTMTQEGQQPEETTQPGAGRP